MTRKVNFEVEVEVLVPVKVKLDLLMRADEGAPLDHYLGRWAKSGETSFAKADIEDVKVEDIYPPWEENDLIYAGKGLVLQRTHLVTDSPVPFSLTEFVCQKLIEHENTLPGSVTLLESKVTDSR